MVFLPYGGRFQSVLRNKKVCVPIVATSNSTINVGH